VEEVAGGLASRMATLGMGVGVLVCSVGSRGRTGSGVRGGYWEREGCRKYGRWEGTRRSDNSVWHHRGQ